MQAPKPKTMKDGLKEVGKILSKKAGKILPSRRRIETLSKETFQSKTFRRAGYHLFSDKRYGAGDRFLYTITCKNGSQIFILTGKISSGNPYEVGHAAGTGLDLRKTDTVIYVYDGKNTITEILSTGETNKHEEEHGKPDTLLPCLKQKAGISIGVENYA